MPRHLPAPLAFRDDPTAEIQVVRRPGCDAVLLCFCAREGTLGFPLNFVHEWLGRLPVSLIYIKDFRDLYGALGYTALGHDRASSVVALRQLARDLGGKRIYALGVSLGGYAALYYGLQVGAEAVLSLCGATDLTPDFNEVFEPASPFHSNLLVQAPDYARNLQDVYAAAKRRPRVLMVFSTGHVRDRKHAEQMAALPDVELVPIGDSSLHNVLQPLIRRGQFFPLLSRLLED
jgi:pimeloyl-ACP methyl ester carboxylesterase